MKAGTWNHLTFTYDGSRTEDGYAFYLNGIRMPIERGVLWRAGFDHCAGAEGEREERRADHASGRRRTARRGSTGSIGEFRVFNRVISEEEARMAAAWPAIAAAASKRSRQLSAAEKDALKLYYLMYRDAGYQALSAEFARVSAEHREIELRSNTAMVLEERPDSKPAAHLLFRGMYDQPRELLERAHPVVPAADGAGAAAKPPRAGAVDGRSRAIRCSRA